jgi:transcriptional regulator with XRE-family HTH domain
MARKAAASGISPEFPQKLREARHRRGLTQGQLSQRIGADVQRVSKYERGVLVPTTEILVRIAEALEVNLDYLLRDVALAAEARIRDPELLERFAEIEGLPDNEREALKLVLEAFITKHRVQEIAGQRGRRVPVHRHD